MQLEIKTAKDGNEIFELVTDERRYTLNSTYRPIVEAEKFAKQYADIEEGSILAVFGYGNGMFPEALAKVCGDKARLLFVEPCKEIAEYADHDHAIEQFCERNDCRAALPCPSGQSAYLYSMEDFPQLLRDVIYYDLDYKVHYCVLPKYKEIFSEEYRKFEESLTYHIDILHANIHTCKVIGHRVIRNNICNLPYVIEGYCGDSFVNLFPKGMPAVIVSAGPSLEKNIHLLKRARNRALILCVDTAIRHLLKENIRPDMVLCVDPQKSLRLFEDERIAGIPLVGSCDMNTEVLNHMKDSPIIFAKAENPMIESMYRLSGHEIMTEYCGGSVATFAFALCCTWGFETIVLVGQDLALTGDRCHVGAEKFERDNLGAELIPVEGIYGDTVYTRRDYYYYIKWFEENIPLHPEIRVIDATEGGARIRGTDIMALKDVIEEYCDKEYDIAKLIESVEPAFNAAQKEELRQRIDNSKQIMLDLVENLQEGIKLAEHGMSVAKKEIARQKKGIMTGAGNELFYKRLNKQIEDLCQYYDSLEEMYLIGKEIDSTELDAYIMLEKEDKSKDLVTQYEWVKRYFGFLMRATRNLVEVYEEL